MSGRDRFFKIDLKIGVRRILNLDAKLTSRRIEKIIIPFIIFDIYIRMEILLGIELSGHNDILTKPSNLIEELNQSGEIQKEQ